MILQICRFLYREEYQIENQSNQDQFAGIVKTVRPDIWQLMNLIDQSKLNSNILVAVAYAIESIATSTNYGQVNIEIEDGICRFVRGITAHKLNEPIIKNENANS